MKIKKILALLTTAALTASLIGCGGTDSENVTTQDTASEVSTEPVTETEVAAQVEDSDSKSAATSSLEATSAERYRHGLRLCT